MDHHRSEVTVEDAISRRADIGMVARGTTQARVSTFEEVSNVSARVHKVTNVFKEAAREKFR